MPEHQETPDSHDLGKLVKWRDGLASATGSEFPVCALFLASGEDIRAHNIFRFFRTAFEELDAGFHDLVIFGQHGMSSTCAALIPRLGLSDVHTPALVLISNDNGIVFHTTGLPSGALPDGAAEDDRGDIPWRAVLTAITATAKEKTVLALDYCEGLARFDFSGGTLVETIEKVKLQVEEA